MRALVVVLLLATVAHASPSTDLTEARNSFRQKDCNSAVGKLSFLLYPHEQLASQRDLIEAHAMLGACRCESARDAAKEEFDKVLQLDPDQRLDELLFSDCALRAFAEQKAARELERARRDALVKLEEQKAALEAYKNSLRFFREQPYGLNFIPFGAGQFSERRLVPGVLFAGGQVASLGISGGIWLYLVSKYGITSNNVPLADGPSVRRMQEVEVGAGIAFILLYGGGVVDALLHWKARVRVQGDDTLLELDKKPPPPPKKTSILDRLHVLPIATAEGGFGLGVALEND